MIAVEECTLECHIPGCPFCAHIVFRTRNLEDSIWYFWSNKAAHLSVHGFWSQSRWYEGYFDPAGYFSFNQLCCRLTPFLDFELQRSILGRTNPLTLGPVMVHTRLT